MRELAQLRELLADLALPDGVPGGDAARQLRQSLVDQIDGLGELSEQDPDATGGPMPFVAALVGPSGAGKSHLLNRLAGREVTPTGELRPTTTGPVWVCNWSDETAVRAVAEADGGEVVISSRLPRGLALVEYNDPGVDTGGTVAPRDADLHLIVTTPTRYADLRVWTQLQGALDNVSEVAVILTRFPEEDATDMVIDLSRMLRARGWEDVMMVALPDGEEALEILRTHLWEFARPSGPEQSTRDRKLGPLLSSLQERVQPIIGAARSAAELYELREVAVTAAAADHPRRWGLAAWAACRADPAIASIVARMDTPAGSRARQHRSTSPGRDVREQDGATLASLPDTLRPATIGSVRELQRALHRATTEIGQPAAVAGPGQASRHAAQMGDAVAEWVSATRTAVTDQLPPTRARTAAAPVTIVLAAVLDAFAELAFSDQLVGPDAFAALLESTLGPAKATDLRAQCAGRLADRLTEVATAYSAAHLRGLPQLPRGVDVERLEALSDTILTVGVEGLT